jgi:hypothetical protein
MPQVTAHAAVGDGPALLDWPYLVWLPQVGVCTEDNHTPVGLIVELRRMGPTADNAALAAIVGTTAEHVRQAVNYYAATHPAP